MTELAIDDGCMDAPSTARQRIRITHLVAREMRIGQRRASLGCSPGVLLILARSANMQVIIDARALRVPQGMSLVVAGDARKTLLTERRRAEHDGTEASVRLIEVSALLNDAVTLREHLDLPRLLDYETSTKLATLYEQLFISSDALRLPGGSADVRRPFLRSDLVMTLLAASAPTGTSPASTDEETRIHQLKRYLVAHLDTRLSAPEIASHMGMSVKTLVRWMRKTVDAAPAQYFKEMRLQKSLELVSQRTLDIDTIAEQTGFPDRYYFTKEFKKRFGTAPARFRKALGAVPTVDLLTQANAYFRHAQFRKALAASARGLQMTTSAVTREQLLFTQGRCLRALGMTADAMAVWEELRHTTYAHQAGLEQCRMLFALGKHDEALERFKALYAEADETEKQDAVRLWMDQVVSMFPGRRTGLLRGLMVLRGELFPHDLASMRLAVDALRVLEENEEVLRQCAQIRPACFHALRRAGNLEEAIARFGDTGPASVLLQFGRYADAEAALARVPDPALSAQLLAESGRAEEAIRRYPEHCRLAYFMLGRYQELLDRFPGPSTERVYALHALGKVKALKSLSSDSPYDWISAQLCVSPDVLLESTLPEAPVYRGRARLLIAIRTLRNGKTARAESCLSNIAGVLSPHLWWEDHSDGELIIASVLRGLLHGREHLAADLDHIVKHFKFKMRQTLWHDAAYLAGVITTAEYLAQPARDSLEARSAFVQAMTHDLAEARSLAVSGYQPFDKQIAPRFSTGLLRQDFARWRLHELGAT